ncbi:Gp15 family bacteriophage protein [Clostridium gasigenes]|uniref:Gp15 family bacteriophage protein n=1 Tax=Clostridium gasigenes TaxID=94869 RepID=UPI003C2F924F
MNSKYFYYSNSKHQYNTDINQAVDKRLYFYRCCKDVSKLNGNRKGVKQIYSFEYDDDYICSAFLDQYSVDL